MTMNWSRPNRESGLRKAVFFTCIVILVGTVDVILAGGLRSLARDALMPFGNSLTSAWGTLMHYTDLSSRADLLDRVASLEEELNHFRERDSLFQVLARENVELRALARMATSSEAISAPIASSFRASPYGTFVVAAGWRDGIEEGALVYSPDGFVLGTIADVGMRTATVRFALAPEARVEAVSGEFAFSLTGQGLANGLARVPVEAPLSIGDPVFAPTLQSGPIGIVTHISSTTASVYSDVFVTLPTNMNVIRHVLIVPRDAE